MSVLLALGRWKEEDQTFTVLSYIVRPDWMMRPRCFQKRNNEEEEKEERSMAHLGDREHTYLLGADNTLQQTKR